MQVNKKKPRTNNGFTQVNVEIQNDIIEDIEEMVKNGEYPSRKFAYNDLLRKICDIVNIRY